LPKIRNKKFPSVRKIKKIGIIIIIIIIIIIYDAKFKDFIFWKRKEFT
jgi:hypothetical protein